MEIKRPHHRPPILTRHARAWLTTVGLSVLGTLLLSGLLGLAYLKHAAPHRFEAFKRLPSQVPSVIGAYFRSLGTEVPEMELAISQRNLQELDYMRQQALQEKGKDFSYVSGEIFWEGEEYPVRLRLKGDRPVHYQYSRAWSFRVEMKERNTLLGMRRFSLHQAGARNYIYEWLFHRWLAAEGLLHLQYHFVNLKINGEQIGLYALEEHFGKQLIERQGYREGPLLALDEAWDGSDLRQAQVLPYDETRWTQGPHAQARLDRAVGLLEGFRQGQLRLEEVFEVEELATYFALCDLQGMPHAAIWKSPSFYYDPLADCLRPVGMDGHFLNNEALASESFLLGTVPRNPGAGWYHAEYRDWFDRFFPDSVAEGGIWPAYFQQLDRLSHPGYVDSLLQVIEPELTHQLQLIDRQMFSPADHLNWYGPDLFRYEPQALSDRAGWIQARLHGMQPRIFVHRLASPDGNLTLAIGNIGMLPLEVIGVEGDSLWAEKAAYIPAQSRRQASLALSYQRLTLPLSSSQSSVTDSAELWLAYRLPGLKDTLRVPVRPWDPTQLGSSLLSPVRPASLQSYECLVVDSVNRVVSIKPGHWSLTQPLLLPAGYALMAGPGTEIDLQAGAFIRTEGPLIWEGSSEAPIKIFSSDGKGQGIAVIGAKAPSRLRHIHLEELSAPEWQGWRLTGALTFYQTQVDVAYLQFFSPLAEDGLNLVQCRGTLAHLQVTGAAGDAIDLDFSEVELVDLDLQNSANDGLDLAGGKVRLEQSQIQGAGDKGISIGEGASAHLSQVHWQNNRIGLAVKDLASVTVEDSRFEQGPIGVALYQKKPEYGPATLQMTGINWANIQRQAVLEAGSSLRLEGEPISPNEPAGLAMRLNPEDN